MDGICRSLNSLQNKKGVNHSWTKMSGAGLIQKTNCQQTDSLKCGLFFFGKKCIFVEILILWQDAIIRTTLAVIADKHYKLWTQLKNLQRLTNWNLAKTRHQKIHRVWESIMILKKSLWKFGLLKSVKQNLNVSTWSANSKIACWLFAHYLKNTTYNTCLLAERLLH